MSRVDEDIPTDEQTPKRKPWWVALTQAADVRRVGGLPDGTTVLLSEDEVLALVAYLCEPQTAVWSENPSPTRPGKVRMAFFSQPGMVALSPEGDLWNGEGDWTPNYFARQQPMRVTKRTRLAKLHTLPWPMPGRM